MMEKEMVTHSSIPAWENPMDSGAQDGQRVGHDLATNHHHHQPMKSHMKINQHMKLTLNRHYEKL